MTDEQRLALLGLVEPQDDDDAIDVLQLVNFALLTIGRLSAYVLRRGASDDDVVQMRKTCQASLKLAGRAIYLHGLTTMPYDAYLQTPEWKARAHEVKLLRGNRCEDCGATTNLEAHHLTYERRGHEASDDLRVLCRECHAKTHGRTVDDLPAHLRAVVKS
jgi:5-methylcytosine-specific restriction endonuclease McrA